MDKHEKLELWVPNKAAVFFFCKWKSPDMVHLMNRTKDVGISGALIGNVQKWSFPNSAAS